MTSPHTTGPAGQQSAAGRPAPFPAPSPARAGGGVEPTPLPAGVRRTVLPSGLRVVSEHVAGVRSASIGVWIGVGSRHEVPALHGGSHFLEHVLFKGTRDRSALDISVELDEVGAEVNAFTAKEYTCFHARVLDADVPLVLDVMGDMLTSSLIADADVEAEREVILDEIAMHDDDPDDVVHNLFAAQAWGDSPYGRPIAGTEASIEAMSPAAVRRFHRRHYRAPRMVVSAAGNVDHDALVALVTRAFGRRGFLDTEAAPETPPLADAAPRPTVRRVRPGRASATRGFEQVNVVLGTAGLARGDERRFAMGILTTGLGGGTSSRLFQEVRERRGLAYSVYAFTTQHVGAGLVGVAVGCLPAKLDATLEVVRAELAAVARGGLDADEVRRGAGQLRAGLVLGMEDTASRMHRLGKGELLGERLLGVDEVIERIDAVTVDEVAELAATVLGGPEVLAVVGPS
ncbi:insulinase family protein [Nocardioides sp. ChNu-153]|uniref:M16 family metallopeptidase n=1 Tax=unclassified Nocardioides TaxID=2615069 RepID=UPI002407139D|nr:MULTISPECIES: pitrilysin family protein [unclassified Nocardioides]MDF9715960.1 insulinase family protein [Nocardioides sp. ChNu-99]MDN7122953.1 insulinase family protein [Nocardioides sp. ChNu-153]